MGIIHVYVHLWDGGGLSGIKVAHFRRNTEPPYEWPVHPTETLFTKDYTALFEDSSVAYLQGKAAKEFLAERGMKFDRERRLLKATLRVNK